VQKTIRWQFYSSARWPQSRVAEILERGAIRTEIAIERLTKMYLEGPRKRTPRWSIRGRKKGAVYMKRIVLDLHLSVVEAAPIKQQLRAKGAALREGDAICKSMGF
jgi:hypothetical protein